MTQGDHYLPEGHLALLRSHHNLDNILVRWLKKGAGREIEYFALIREIEIRLTMILQGKPPPLTMRQMVAAALEQDGSFRYVVANDLSSENCRDPDTWQLVLHACAGTLLALYESRGSTQ